MVFTPQVFKSMFDRFSTLCRKGLTHLRPVFHSQRKHSINLFLYVVKGDMPCQKDHSRYWLQWMKLFRFTNKQSYSALSRRRECMVQYVVKGQILFLVGFFAWKRRQLRTVWYLEVKFKLVLTVFENFERSFF